MYVHRISDNTAYIASKEPDGCESPATLYSCRGCDAVDQPASYTYVHQSYGMPMCYYCENKDVDKVMEFLCKNCGDSG